jgi:hypothetical protein
MTAHGGKAGERSGLFFCRQPSAVAAAEAFRRVGGPGLPSKCNVHYKTRPIPEATRNRGLLPHICPYSAFCGVGLPYQHRKP